MTKPIVIIDGNEKYMGELKAAEKLRNESVCVLENGEIRNLKSDEIINDKLMVYVSNWHPVGKVKEYIDKGEYVRYTTL